MKRVMMLVLVLLCRAIITPSAFGARGESSPVAIDTVTVANLSVSPLVESLALWWDATWVGGNSGATVVIKDNGTEVKRATGTGSFTWTPSTVGPHTLTYTTLIEGTAQSEVYSVMLYSEWKYIVSNGKAMITETTHTTGNVTIPDSLNGYPVTEIPTNFFSGCSGLTSVVIPSSVTSVGANAFSGCSGLTSVTIPPSVTSVGENAFAGCNGLTEVRISDLEAWCGISFANVNANPLSKAKKLYLNGAQITDLSIPSGVTSIGAYAFN